MWFIGLMLGALCGAALDGGAGSGGRRDLWCRGWRLRERRPTYALTLQGAGIAVLYAFKQAPELSRDLDTPPPAVNRRLSSAARML